jgi:hypothetical protein
MYRSPDEALHRPWHWIAALLPDFGSAFVGYTTVTLLAAAVVGAVVAWRRSRGLPLLLLLWCLVPFGLGVLLALTAYPRYVVGAAPPLVPLAAVGLLAIAGAGRRLDRPAVAIGVAALLVVPALAADARFVADPGRTSYPGLDEEQFASGWAAGNAWVALDRELERLRPDGVLVADYGLGSPVTELELGSRGVSLIEGPSEQADRAPLIVDNGVPHPEPAVGELREIWRYERPDDGTPLVLYQRGVTVGDRFVTNADELRSVVDAPTDAAFDAWLAARPQALAWYEAWHADPSYR